MPRSGCRPTSGGSSDAALRAAGAASSAPTDTTAPALTVAERTYGPDERRERHPFVQLVLPKRGRLDMAIAGHHGAAEGDTCAVVPADADHAYRSPGPNRFLVVDLGPSAPPPHTGDPFRPIDARLEAFARLLAVEARLGSLADPLVADALARYAAALLADLGRATREPLPAAPPLAERLRDIVESRLTEPLTLAEIAAAAAVGPAHAARVFRHAFGVSIVTYVQDARIERAKPLLVETDRSVTEVAAAVGFASPAYFSRLFARLTGHAPTAWRSLRRGSDTNGRGS